MTFKHWLSNTAADLGSRTPQIAWHLPLHGMIRTPIPDPDDDSALFVVTYREKFREYGVYRLDRDSGSIGWTTLIRNGGYGSPLVHRDGVFALSRFTAVTGLDKSTGEIRFEFDTLKRIRSSVSRGLAHDEILFTAGNEIHWLATDGTPRACVSLEGTFFFGLPEAVRDGDDEVVITLATRQRFRKSHVYALAIGRDGCKRWEHDLGPGFVVSSDTSGVGLTDELVIASTADGRIVALDRTNGSLRWESRIDALAVRHLPVVGAGRVFVTTLEGSLCSVCVDDGSDVRTLPLTDQGVWMPPTVVGNDVFVVADNEMLQLAVADLAILSRTAVGEAPYSQMSFADGRLYIGGGDPPYDGYVFAIDLDGAGRDVVAASVREVHDAARSDDVVVSLRLMGDQVGLRDVELDLRCLGGEIVPATRLRPGLYSAQCHLGRGRRFGTYAVPVLLHYGDEIVVRTIRVRIEDSTPIPVRHEIDITVPRQTGINTSGGAVLQAVFEHYGRSVDQREIRRIADHALEVSDDYSPFQLWRLVTRRVAATGANNLEEFELRGS